MSKYYDGTKLLSLKDINGNKPEIYISTSNRSAGKTTYFARWLVKRFLEHGEKFILVYRFNYELADVAEKFFKEIHNLFYPDHEMVSVTRSKNVYNELFLDNKPCGYAIALNNADMIKKLSHLFSDASRMFFDEFQSEINHYCPNEVEKLLSVHTSIARGNGEQVKYLPVYMVGNFVSLLNPYYSALGISHRLQQNTKYLRGDGFVLEQGFYENVAEQQKDSAFNRAFKKSNYVKFATEKIYLNDRNTFIDKLTGNNTYVCTVKYKDKFFGIRKYIDNGLLYCSNSYDDSYPVKVCFDASMHDEKCRLMTKADYLLQTIKTYFDIGSIRFQNMECKECIFEMLNYALF